MEIIEQYRAQIKKGEQNLQTAIAALDGVGAVIGHLTSLVNELNDIADHVGNLDSAGLEVLGGPELEKALGYAAEQFNNALHYSQQWFPTIEAAGALIGSMED